MLGRLNYWIIFYSSLLSTNGVLPQVGESAQMYRHCLFFRHLYLACLTCGRLYKSKDMPAIARLLLSPASCLLFYFCISSLQDLLIITGACVGLKSFGSSKRYGTPRVAAAAALRFIASHSTNFS